MPKLSAGLVLYRMKGGGLEVFLVHPGGPFWKSKDAGAWSIPKGEYAPGDDALDAARREFTEETGFALTAGDFKPLGELKQPSGKIISAWAVQGDFPAEESRSNLFTMEWPPRSGKKQEFPEVDRAEWFTLDVASEKLIAGQHGFLDRLIFLLR